ncbi:MAG: hypothetical protein ACOX5X_04355 [Acholeplasmataceae bacterium]
MKSLKNMSRTQLNSEKLMMLLDTYEQKGKEYYYDKLFEKDQEILFSSTMEEDFYYIGKFFNFDFTDFKLRQWSKKNFQARNKEEEQFNNYKTVLKRIAKAGKNFELIHTHIVDLSRLISKNVRKVNINYVENEEKNMFHTTSRKPMTFALEELIKLFYDEIKHKNHETIALIINFYIDFVNMEIFSHYNEEMGLFLMYALLLKDFNVFKYVSFFKYLYFKEQVFKQGVLEANYNWQEGYSSYERLYILFIDILKDSYLELKEKAHKYELQTEYQKGAYVRITILKGPEIFTKQDVREKNPLASDSTIERILKTLRDEGYIRPLGTGRSAKWQLVFDNKDYTHTQLSFFSETDFE